ncbi:MAG: hypothetical protein AVDCRST_MAG78-1738 [uncultured Rubrobacteraceae bacterium]|uniref:Uncharacterized protein n=1 Tax=uncultured Rubrobacteraceae bacterium TaxID=349277 RepID=A0A6J4Q654_9ACTN|nr:MAG: hypothetical protein AVDCRST_MAG78-1738 [uncultured Rubrobacteraceae bacterium]
METVQTQTPDIDGGRKARTTEVGPPSGGEEGYIDSGGWMALSLRVLPKNASRRDILVFGANSRSGFLARTTQETADEMFTVFRGRLDVYDRLSGAFRLGLSCALVRSRCPIQDLPGPHWNTSSVPAAFRWCGWSAGPPGDRLQGRE